MKKILLASVLVATMLLSGCTEPDSSELHYSNDIITIEDLYVSDSSPYEGEVVVMEMLVQNNGEEPVPDVEIAFKTPGFDIQNLYCEGAYETSIGDQSDARCSFGSVGEYKSIDSLDYRRVILTMKVKDIGILTQKVYTVNYNVNYDYSGFRSMNIPIIDGVTVKTPSSQYSQSDETYGPIRLSFELPESGQTIEDGQTIHQYWGVRDNPFKVKLKFTHISSSNIGETADPVLEKGDVVIDTRGSLDVASFGGANFYCNFEEKSGVLVSSKSLEVPGELMCNFQSSQSWEIGSDEPETYAYLWVSYSYAYGYSGSYDFNIEPNPTASSRTSSPDAYTSTSTAVTGESTDSP